ncbi:MAG: class I SAM-dependent methyltransferase [Wenzhouxiangella sp.]
MSKSNALEFTGERFTPECVREMAYEHWHRYAWVSRWVSGKRVLDAASGEGYGSAMLARSAESVIGVDLSEASIAHARQRYPADNLRFEQADCLELPLPDASVDVVVSFETLEHLAEHDQLLQEFKRVLRPGGFLALSSPDRKTYSDDTGYDNPFHVRELYRPELEALLARHFPAWRLFGQKLAFQSLLWSIAPEQGAECLTLTDTELRRGQQPQLQPLYYLALAAADESDLPAASGLSLYGDQSESVYAHYNDVVRKHIRAEQALAEREQELAELKAELRAELARPWWQRWFRA